MKPNKTLLLAATFALCGQLLAEVPKVSNIRASQLDDTKLVEILYDVEDAENDKLTIRVEISADGGERYNVPARTFEGALGANVDPGKDKKITWNAGLDWDGEFSDKMRVRITASDGKGLAGLEWSKEIPPGGFLMGQDGGPEGSGPSIHLNISYPFWITKFEITNKQFAEFMNLAYAANKIRTDGKAKNFSTMHDAEQRQQVIALGDSHNIRWNVNKFEVVKNPDHAVVVNFVGAQSFAEFYGYDLPIESEWEKAARGPEFDDAGEHQVYPWGNDENRLNVWIQNQPVGWWDGINTSQNLENGYGIHDLSGNHEWTCSLFKPLQDHSKKPGPPSKNLRFPISNKYYVMKGYRALYQRQSMHAPSWGGTFRLVRRN
jgi:formylglycine-generating enzyme required for sulfatase activity